MKKAFRDELVEKLNNTTQALHELLTVTGSITDVTEVDSSIVATASAAVVEFHEYAIVLRAREVD